MGRLAEFTYDKDSVLVSRPTYIIEVVLAVLAFLFGAYVTSPLYQTQVTDPGASSFQGNELVRLAAACVFFFVPALITFLSIFFWKLRANHWRRRATVSQFLGWFFIALLQLVSIGFYPVSWMFSLTLAVIAAVCHFAAKAEWRSRGG